MRHSTGRGYFTVICALLDTREAATSVRGGVSCSCRKAGAGDMWDVRGERERGGEGKCRHTRVSVHSKGCAPARLGFATHGALALFIVPSRLLSTHYS